VKGDLIRLDDFHGLQRSVLTETNQLLAESLARGNITFTIDGLEMSVPVREVVQEGKKDLFVLLRGKPEPGDRFLRVKITPQLQVEKVRTPQEHADEATSLD